MDSIIPAPAPAAAPAAAAAAAAAAASENVPAAAAAAPEEQDPTPEQRLAGTAAYQAPETAAGKEALAEAGGHGEKAAAYPGVQENKAAAAAAAVGTAPGTSGQSQTVLRFRAQTGAPVLAPGAIMSSAQQLGKRQEEPAELAGPGVGASQDGASEGTRRTGTPSAQHLGKGNQGSAVLAGSVAGVPGQYQSGSPVVAPGAGTPSGQGPSKEHQGSSVLAGSAAGSLGHTQVQSTSGVPVVPPPAGRLSLLAAAMMPSAPTGHPQSASMPGSSGPQAGGHRVAKAMTRTVAHLDAPLTPPTSKAHSPKPGLPSPFVRTGRPAPGTNAPVPIRNLSALEARAALRKAQPQPQSQTQPPPQSQLQSSQPEHQQQQQQQGTKRRDCKTQAPLQPQAQGQQPQAQGQQPQAQGQQPQAQDQQPEGRQLLTQPEPKRRGRQRQAQAGSLTPTPVADRQQQQRREEYLEQQQPPRQEQGESQARGREEQKRRKEIQQLQHQQQQQQQQQQMQQLQQHILQQQQKQQHEQQLQQLQQQILQQQQQKAPEIEATQKEPLLGVPQAQQTVHSSPTQALSLSDLSAALKRLESSQCWPRVEAALNALSVPNPQGNFAQRETAQRDSAERDTERVGTAQGKTTQRATGQRYSAHGEPEQGEYAQRRTVHWNAEGRDSAHRVTGQGFTTQAGTPPRGTAERETVQGAAQRATAQRNTAQTAPAQGEAAWEGITGGGTLQRDSAHELQGILSAPQFLSELAAALEQGERLGGPLGAVLTAMRGALALGARTLRAGRMLESGSGLRSEAVLESGSVLGSGSAPVVKGGPLGGVPALGGGLPQREERPHEKDISKEGFGSGALSVPLTRTDLAALVQSVQPAKLGASATGAAVTGAPATGTAVTGAPVTGGPVTGDAASGTAGTGAPVTSALQAIHSRQNAVPAASSLPLPSEALVALLAQQLSTSGARQGGGLTEALVALLARQLGTSGARQVGGLPEAVRQVGGLPEAVRQRATSELGTTDGPQQGGPTSLAAALTALKAFVHQRNAAQEASAQPQPSLGELPPGLPHQRGQSGPPPFAGAMTVLRPPGFESQAAQEAASRAQEASVPPQPLGPSAAPLASPLLSALAGLQPGRSEGTAARTPGTLDVPHLTPEVIAAALQRLQQGQGGPPVDSQGHTTHELKRSEGPQADGVPSANKESMHQPVPEHGLSLVPVLGDAQPGVSRVVPAVLGAPGTHQEPVPESTSWQAPTLVPAVTDAQPGIPNAGPVVRGAPGIHQESAPQSDSRKGASRLADGQPGMARASIPAEGGVPGVSQEAVPVSSPEPGLSLVPTGGGAVVQKQPEAPSVSATTGGGAPVVNQGLVPVAGPWQGISAERVMPGMGVLLALAMQHMGATVGNSILRDLVVNALAAQRRAEESERLLQELRTAIVEVLGSVHHLTFTKVTELERQLEVERCRVAFLESKLKQLQPPPLGPPPLLPFSTTSSGLQSHATPNAHTHPSTPSTHTVPTTPTTHTRPTTPTTYTIPSIPSGPHGTQASQRALPHLLGSAPHAAPGTPAASPASTTAPSPLPGHGRALAPWPPWAGAKSLFSTDAQTSALGHAPSRSQTEAHPSARGSGQDHPNVQDQTQGPGMSDASLSLGLSLALLGASQAPTSVAGQVGRTVGAPSGGGTGAPHGGPTGPLFGAGRKGPGNGMPTLSSGLLDVTRLHFSFPLPPPSSSPSVGPTSPVPGFQSGLPSSTVFGFRGADSGVGALTVSEGRQTGLIGGREVCPGGAPLGGGGDASLGFPGGATGPVYPEDATLLSPGTQGGQGIDGELCPGDTTMVSPGMGKGQGNLDVLLQGMERLNGMEATSRKRKARERHKKTQDTVREEVSEEDQEVGEAEGRSTVSGMSPEKVSKKQQAKGRRERGGDVKGKEEGEGKGEGDGEGRVREKGEGKNREKGEGRGHASARGKGGVRQLGRGKGRAGLGVVEGGASAGKAAEKSGTPQSDPRHKPQSGGGVRTLDSANGRAGLGLVEEGVVSAQDLRKIPSAASRKSHQAASHKSQGRARRQSPVRSHESPGTTRHKSQATGQGGGRGGHMSHKKARRGETETITQEEVSREGTTSGNGTGRGSGAEKEGRVRQGEKRRVGSEGGAGSQEAEREGMERQGMKKKRKSDTAEQEPGALAGDSGPNQVAAEPSPENDEVRVIGGGQSGAGLHPHPPPSGVEELLGRQSGAVHGSNETVTLERKEDGAPRTEVRERGVSEEAEGGELSVSTTRKKAVAEAALGATDGDGLSDGFGPVVAYKRKSKVVSTPGEGGKEANGEGSGRGGEIGGGYSERQYATRGSAKAGNRAGGNGTVDIAEERGAVTAAGSRDEGRHHATSGRTKAGRRAGPSEVVSVEVGAEGEAGGGARTADAGMTHEARGSEKPGIRLGEDGIVSEEGGAQGGGTGTEGVGRVYGTRGNIKLQLLEAEERGPKEKEEGEGEGQEVLGRPKRVARAPSRWLSSEEYVL